MKLSTWFMLILGLVIIGLIIYSYFTDKLPAPLPTYHRDAAAKTTAAPPTVSQILPAVKAGQPFLYGGVTYSIGDITKPQNVRQGATIFKPSGVFLQIELTAANSTDRPVTLAPSDYVLVDAQGRVYSLDRTATAGAVQTAAKNDLFREDLQPGLKKDTLLVFDVPAGAKNFSLRISGGYVTISLPQ
jgi:hypothetical protein